MHAAPTATFRQCHRQFQRPPHARRVSLAGARDVERGTVIGRRAGKWESEGHVHRLAEAGHLDGRHANIMIRREHRVEFSPERAHEHRVSGQRTGGAQLRSRRRQHPAVLVAKGAAFTCMRIQCAHRQPGRGQPEPVLQCCRRDAAGGHDPLRREQRRHIAKRHVCRHQHDAEAIRRKHHGHRHVAREMGQPFGMTGPGKSGQVQRMLVGRRRDDAVHLACHGHARGRLDGVAGDAAGPDCTGVIGAFANAKTPGPDAYPPSRGQGRDLVFRTDQHQLGIERLGERAPGDLGADAPRITERHGQPDGHGVRMSMYVDWRRWSR
jgi:hypothetical protein